MANNYARLNKLVSEILFHFLIKFILKAWLLFIPFTIFSFFLSKNVNYITKIFHLLFFIYLIARQKRE